MKALTIIGILLMVTSGVFIALTIYVCNYIMHSCLGVILNIPVMIFFIGLACVAYEMLDDEEEMV
jgi:hypothetical protein